MVTDNDILIINHALMRQRLDEAEALLKLWQDYGDPATDPTDRPLRDTFQHFERYPKEAD